MDRMTKTEVLERKWWTRTKVDKYLPEPDDLRENPRCSWKPIKLYDKSRVLAVETKQINKELRDGKPKQTRTWKIKF